MPDSETAFIYEKKKSVDYINGITDVLKIINDAYVANPGVSAQAFIENLNAELKKDSPLPDSYPEVGAMKEKGEKGRDVEWHVRPKEIQTKTETTPQPIVTKPRLAFFSRK